ncbi:MAG TPA: CAAX prenyl protease-related protein [Chthoniobacterales bacterium]|jgi:CAAX prenyl protease-like protein|nr:CAAX prenyl protease-related protein [Chthoniobacterales bacterium]
MPEKRKIAAYLLPILVFAALLLLNSGLKKIGDHFWLSSAEYWIYPAQMVLCGCLLIWFWREYNFERPRHIAFAVLIGVAVFLIWISPQQFLGSSSRVTGFNPDVFASRPSVYWMTIVLRFLRLAVVVPFIEEIFWRGFLLRFLIDENFERVPVGAFSLVSFVVVTVGFGFSHASEDWIAALLTGALYNGVAYRTKRLSSCILTHAVTNLLLGLWIMKTKQWGFW